MTRDFPSFFLDSNLFIDALDARETTKRVRSLDVIERVTYSRRGAVSTQVLSEVYTNLIRATGVAMPTAEAEQAVLSISRSFFVVELSAFAVTEAMRVSRRYRMSYFDSLIWAAASLSGIRTVLTQDEQSSPTVEGVNIRNPLDMDFDMSTLD